MSTFILAFGFFLVIVFVMAIGYMVKGNSIAGSCGGLGALGIEKACDCPEPCDRKRARQARAKLRETKLKQWQEDQIL